MKANIHPDYRYVVYRDRSADFAILTRSTIRSTKTVVWHDGNTYPVIDVDVSSASHPFWTGRHRVLDTAGRIDVSAPSTSVPKRRANQRLPTSA